MPILSDDGKSVTVESGDTLWGIADKYCGGGPNFKKLATLNKISNPNRIAVGQVIKLTEDANVGGETPSPSTPATKPDNSNKPTIDQFGLLSNADNTLFAAWSWNKSHTESYKVLWTYDTGDSIWLVGSNSSNTVDKDSPAIARQSTYNIPSGAKRVQFKVKPISETYTKNDTETNYWEAEWSTVKTYTDSTPLETPDVPTVTIEKYKLTAELKNIDVHGATGIEFEIVKNNATSPFKTGKAEIVSTDASFSCTVDAGGEYKVRCRAYKGSEYSDWTAYSTPAKTIPATPTGITEIRAIKPTVVHLEWSAADTATSYDVEYAAKKEYFDITDQTTTKTGIETTIYDIYGLESGHEYYFRVRAVNSEGHTAWSDSKSIIVGSTPAAPTTWSSTTTAITGEIVKLYWVHNSEDGSSQTWAQLKFYVDGVEQPTVEIENSTDEEEKDKTSVYPIDTKGYLEGTKIQWKVRTSGVTNELGDWSVERTVDVYAPPTLELDITKRETDDIVTSIRTIESFPFYIEGNPGPKTQAPVSYHLAIISNSTYETTDSIGNPMTINAGEEVYSKYFDTNEELLVEFSAGNIDLQNNITYTAKCVVSMNSGLTAESSLDFSVAWTDMDSMVNAEIGIDSETLTAYIRPYCVDINQEYYAVNHESGKYTLGEKLDGPVWGDMIRGCYIVVSRASGYIKGTTELDPLKVFGEDVLEYKTNTGETIYSGIKFNDNGTTENIRFCYVEPDVPAVTETGETVYIGADKDGNDIYYTVIETTTPVTNVYLSVYRREFDGSFTEIASGLDGAKNTTVTDPHPALDFARYRIVATSKDTGAVSYYDAPGYPVGGKAAVIQWDEEWSRFEVFENETLEQPPWSGSMLKLPYNIDVSDSNTPDVTKVEYAGRKHPVVYYGTQLGYSSNWNMEIEKSDKETLYALRRLQRWMGDVYVREPSGSGYWANIAVSFSQKHCEVTIPVTLTITRVEGGM